MLSGATHPLKGQGFDKFYTGQTYKTKCTVFPVHVINAYTRWTSVVNCVPVALQSQERNLVPPRGGPQSQYGSFGNNNYCLYQDSNPGPSRQWNICYTDHATWTSKIPP